MGTYRLGGLEYHDPFLTAASFAKADSTNLMGDYWKVLITGTTGGTVVDSALPGGGINMTLAAEDDGATQIVGPRAYEVDVGVPIVMEVDVNVSVDASTAAAIFIGLTDNNSDTLEVPIEDEDGTLATGASDAVGFMLEAEQDATWQAVSVDTDVDGAQTALTSATDYAVGTWQRLRMEVNSSGDADFYIGQYDSSNRFQGWANQGNSLHTRSASHTTSVRMCPIISLDSRNAAVTAQFRNFTIRGNGLEVTG